MKWLARGENNLPDDRSWLGPGEATRVAGLRYTKRRTELPAAVPPPRQETRHRRRRQLRADDSHCPEGTRLLFGVQVGDDGGHRLTDRQKIILAEGFQQMPTY